MDTEEAIGMVCIGREQPLEFAEAHEIVELLRCGEKYEAIVNELKEKYGKKHHFYAIKNERFCSGNEIIIYLSQTIFELEQKYFPKPKSRWQRINDVVEILNTMGVSPDRKELINLLIELRDEEIK